MAGTTKLIGKEKGMKKVVPSIMILLAKPPLKLLLEVIERLIEGECDGNQK